MLKYKVKDNLMGNVVLVVKNTTRSIKSKTKLKKKLVILESFIVK